MKLAELVEAQTAMRNLANQKMPAKVAYALAKNIRLMTPEVETFEQTRIKLLEENWPFNEQTHRYDVPPEKMPEWEAMVKELMQQEVEITPYKFDRALLDSIQISPAEYIAISWMLNDPD